MIVGKRECGHYAEKLDQLIEYMLTSVGEAERMLLSSIGLYACQNCLLWGG